jgi:hypothetical protein
MVGQDTTTPAVTGTNTVDPVVTPPTDNRNDSASSDSQMITQARKRNQDAVARTNQVNLMGAYCALL